ncbi:MAG: hypothetical protein R3F41_10860 [Gammaproteobacteria bacterium]|nr:hypothetical protein [Pseudomonadales bacterium]MCP5348109.1 hypothetical protein [Pseudomonadales bacterium]
MIRYLTFAVLIMLGFTSQAQAYIDPVTGSVIIQSLIGAFAVVLVALRGFRDRIVGIFRTKSESEDEDDQQSTSES